MSKKPRGKRRGSAKRTTLTKAMQLPPPAESAHAVSLRNHLTLTINEILALDLLTLRGRTERAGDVHDADQHRVRLQASLEVCAVCSVRKAGELVAYAMLRPESETCWFVSGLSTHPLHRTPAVTSELLSNLAGLAGRLGIVELRS